MTKNNNRYLDKDYKPYKDKRWTDIPSVDVLKKNVGLTKKQQEKVNKFRKFLEEDTKRK